MTIRRRIVPLILIAAAIAGVWAGSQVYLVFAGG